MKRHRRFVKSKSGRLEFVNTDKSCAFLPCSNRTRFSFAAELRRDRISFDTTEIDRTSNHLSEIEESIQNIIRAFEQGAVSDTLVKKLKQLEVKRESLSEKIKFLSGTDQSQIYITPAVIEERFSQIPELLRSSRPFEIHKALNPLLGKAGIKIHRGVGPDGQDEHSAEGFGIWGVQ